MLKSGLRIQYECTRKQSTNRLCTHLYTTAENGDRLKCAKVVGATSSEGFLVVSVIFTGATLC